MRSKNTGITTKHRKSREKQRNQLHKLAAYFPRLDTSQYADALINEEGKK